MIFLFIFYNAFPDRNVYCSYGISITNQTYNTSIISYNQSATFSLSSPTRSLYFTIFNQDGSEIIISTNALTGLTSTTGNMIGLIPSVDNPQGDVVIKLGDESKACLIYQNMALNTDGVTIHNSQSMNPIALIINRQIYSVCSGSNIAYLPQSMKFCTSSNKLCINSTYAVSDNITNSLLIILFNNRLFLLYL
jgi:hypothetical protein